jgi:hypothetical protein
MHRPISRSAIRNWLGSCACLVIVGLGASCARNVPKTQHAASQAETRAGSVQDRAPDALAMRNLEQRNVELGSLQLVETRDGAPSRASLHRARSGRATAAR